MKPRNKRERRVLELADTLPALGPEYGEYVKKEMKAELYYRMNGDCKCGRCGAEWKEMPSTARYWRTSLYNALGVEAAECPECGLTLRPIYERGKHNHTETKLLQVIETCEGWQVLRYMSVTMRTWEGEPTTYDRQEEYQIWLDAEGHEVIVTHPWTRTPFNITIRRDQPLTIGYHNTSYTGSYYYEDMFSGYAGVGYPRVKVIPELTRNGWTKKDARLGAEMRYEIMRGLLTDPRLETIAKNGDRHLLLYYAQNTNDLGRYWPQIRIAVKHGYGIADVQMWQDMVNWLTELGMDSHSPKYLCPADLQKEHDRLLKKVTDKREKEERERQARKDKKYYAAHRQFGVLAVVCGGLNIRPLLTATELLEEGKAMHHCVGTYGDKLTSLILSVRDEQDKRLETVEVGLKRYDIIQSRAIMNGETPRHEEILEAVRGLMPRIRKANEQANKV